MEKRIKHVYEFINDPRGRVSAYGLMSLFRSKNVMFETETDEKHIKVIIFKE